MLIESGYGHPKARALRAAKPELRDQTPPSTPPLALGLTWQLGVALFGQFFFMWALPSIHWQAFTWQLRNARPGHDDLLPAMAVSTPLRELNFGSGLMTRQCAVAVAVDASGLSFNLSSRHAPNNRNEIRTQL